MKLHIERFAPSPTGPLHFGSLVCAFISYIHARQNNAQWLVRIEDVYLQRCKQEYIPAILNSLTSHGMHWDAQVTQQTSRYDIYEDSIEKLRSLESIYSCWCTRKEIKARAEHYDQYCLQFLNSKHQHPSAEDRTPTLRWQNSTHNTGFFDHHLGEQHPDTFMNWEDPIFKRADGSYAYHLAVVSDDIEQGISHIVRGSDLLDTTPLHRRLFELLGADIPQYTHIPIAVHSPGVKYAKQRNSPAIDDTKAVQNLQSCLCFMGVPLETAQDLCSLDDIYKWTLEHWRMEMLPKQREIIVSQSNSLYSVHS